MLYNRLSVLHSPWSKYTKLIVRETIKLQKLQLKSIKTKLPKNFFMTLTHSSSHIKEWGRKKHRWKRRNGKDRLSIPWESGVISVSETWAVI